MSGSSKVFNEICEIIYFDVENNHIFFWPFPCGQFQLYFFEGGAGSAAGLAGYVFRNFTRPLQERFCNLCAQCVNILIGHFYNLIVYPIQSHPAVLPRKVPHSLTFIHPAARSPNSHILLPLCMSNNFRLLSIHNGSPLRVIGFVGIAPGPKGRIAKQRYRNISASQIIWF